MSLEHLHRFLIPGTGKHHRDGNRHPAFDQPLEGHVHAMAHPAIIATNDEVDGIDARHTPRRGLTIDCRSECDQPNDDECDRAKWPRTPSLTSRKACVLHTRLQLLNGTTARRAPNDNVNYRHGFTAQDRPCQEGLSESSRNRRLRRSRTCPLPAAQRPPAFGGRQEPILDSTAERASSTTRREFFPTAHDTAPLLARPHDLPSPPGEHR